MAKKKSQSGSDSETEMSLEMAMSELGQIVSHLESGQATLDESLAQFERGMSLLRVCHRKLDLAAQRIELVTQLSAEGDVITEDFDATSTLQKNASVDAARARKTPATPTAGDKEDEDDSGLLF
jgi:exodeoxyribonuclease VII small subunit